MKSKIDQYNELFDESKALSDQMAKKFDDALKAFEKVTREIHEDYYDIANKSHEELEKLGYEIYDEICYASPDEYRKLKLGDASDLFTVYAEILNSDYYIRWDFYEGWHVSNE